MIWRIDASWYPGALVIEQREVADLLRILLEAPRGRGRERLLAKLRATHPSSVPHGADDAMVPAGFSEQEQAHRALIEDAALQRVPLHFSYESPTSSPSLWRHASVQRVFVGPQLRFVAVCHRSGEARVFRASRVLAGRLDPSTAYRSLSREAVDAIAARMVDGFDGPGAVVRCELVLLAPEARWTVQQIPAAQPRLEPVADGVRVVVDTAAVVPLARWVVGLGRLARCESSELREAVRALAAEALKAPPRAGD